MVGRQFSHGSLHLQRALAQPDRKLTHTISPTLLNEMSYTYGSNYGSGKPPAMNILGAREKPSGYNAVPIFGENPHNLIPDMGFSGGWGGISTLWGPWWAHHNISQLSDDLLTRSRAPPSRGRRVSISGLVLPPSPLHFSAILATLPGAAFEGPVRSSLTLASSRASASRSGSSSN